MPRSTAERVLSTVCSRTCLELRSCVLCLFRPQKAVWHGSSERGRRLDALNCESWRAGDMAITGQASFLYSGLLNQQTRSCSNHFIVLCIETSNDHKTIQELQKAQQRHRRWYYRYWSLSVRRWTLVWTETTWTPAPSGSGTGTFSPTKAVFLECNMYIGQIPALDRGDRPSPWHFDALYFSYCIFGVDFPKKAFFYHVMYYVLLFCLYLI